MVSPPSQPTLSQPRLSNTLPITVVRGSWSLPQGAAAAIDNIVRSFKKAKNLTNRREYRRKNSEKIKMQKKAFYQKNKEKKNKDAEEDAD